MIEDLGEAEGRTGFAALKRPIWTKGISAFNFLRALSATLIRSSPSGAVGAVVLLVVVCVTILAPLLAQSGDTAFVGRPYAGVLTHTYNGGLMWLGSDGLGRDELARLLYGGRISLSVGLLSPLIGVSAGSLFAIISAYFGGVVDLIFQRFVDALLSLPGLVMALTVTFAFGFTLWVVVFAIAVFSFVNTIRIVRSHVLSLREYQFVEAQRAIGSSHVRIIFRHITPNTLPVSVVLFAVGIAGAIIAEAQLDFLGIGIAPPTPTWGNMLSNAQSVFSVAPQLAIIPGVLISATVLAVNLLGDAVRDLIDPRLRGR